MRALVVAEMYSIVIQEKNGPRRVETFDQNEVTIGRVQGNDIVLPKGNISKRHSRIVLRDGKFIIVDLKSTNGTYVNGKRINSPQVLKDVDKIYIGDFTLTLEGTPAEAPPPEPEPEGIDADMDLDEDPLEGLGAGDLDDDGLGDLDADDDDLFPADPPAVEAAAPEPDLDDDLLDFDEPSPEPQKRPVKEAPPPPAPRKERAPSRPRVPAAAAQAPRLDVSLPPAAALQARAAVFSSVLKAISQQGLASDDESTVQKAAGAAERTLAAVAKKLAGANTEGWATQIAKEICALGPLEPLLADADVEEIFINGPHQILQKKGGRLSPVDAFFSSEEALTVVVRRMLGGAGVAFDAQNPIGEARLSDGTRVNAVHHAAAVKGPIVTITRSSQRAASLDELVGEDVLSEAMATFLETCVRARKNVVICGGAGAGVGTLLHAVAATIPPAERIVTVEQVARLSLPQPHVVSLEPRPPRTGPLATSMRDLVANALRMRPDRLVVHEVASGEAMELSIAMGGGQDGTLFSTYASSARDCLDRLETMMLMAGHDLPTRVVREQIASSLDVVVLLTRFADGSYRVTQIAEVVGTEVDIITTNDIFTFKREGFDDNGGVIGRFTSSGSPPRFYEELQRRGEQVDLGIFRD